MEFYKYELQPSCCPRTSYAEKHVKILSDRYGDLCERLPSHTERNNRKTTFQVLCQADILEMTEILQFSDEKVVSEKSFVRDLDDLVKTILAQQENNYNLILIVRESAFKESMNKCQNMHKIIVIDKQNRDEKIECYKQMPCVYVSLKEHVSRHISDIMERNVFKEFDLRNKCETLGKELDTMTNVEVSTGTEMTEDEEAKGPGKEEKEEIEMKERLYDEMVGMFSRSSLPKNERPHVDEDADGCISNKLKHDLQTLSPAIRSCGYRGRTLVIFVDGNIDSNTLESGLQKIRIEHSISAVSIEPFCLNELSSIKVGANIEADFSDGSSRGGTLGGFGRMVTRGEGQTIGLVSRHVVSISEISAKNIRIQNEGEQIEASVLIDNSFSKKKQNILDIAAISFDRDHCDFNTNYVTSEEKAARGVLLSTYSQQKLRGLPVQISGAATPIGHGTVAIPKLEAVREHNVYDENFIIIEDSFSRDTEGKTFCKEGDSGAIVCSDDQENREQVQLISMVIGENTKKKGTYVSLKLDKGIKQVEEEIFSQIELP